ncbi:6472_t:CDS:1, partial [Dentiscutata erythropus]
LSIQNPLSVQSLCNIVDHLFNLFKLRIVDHPFNLELETGSNWF